MFFSSLQVFLPVFFLRVFFIIAQALEILHGCGSVRHCSSVLDSQNLAGLYCWQFWQQGLLMPHEEITQCMVSGGWSLCYLL